MLAFFRNEKNQYIIKGTMILLAGSFVFLGFAGNMSGYTNSATVMETKNSKLTVREFDGQIRQAVGMMKMYSPSFDINSFVSNPGFFQNFFRQLTYTTIVDSYAIDRDFIMSNDQAHKIIASMREFQDAEGNFNYETFKYAVQNAGYTEKGFTNKIKADSAQKLTNQLLITPSIISNQYKEQFFMEQDETKDILVTEISPKNFMMMAQAPEDKDLEELYEQKKSQFMLPETRDISYIEIPASLENQDETAENVSDDIIGGETLQAVASKYKLKKTDVNNINAAKKQSDKVVQKHLQTIFSLDTEEESNALTEGSSLYILMVNNITESKAKPLKSVKSEVLRMWNKKQREKSAYLNLNEVLKQINTGTEFKLAAKQNGLKTKSISIVKSDTSDKKVESKLKEAIFSKNSKENKSYIIKGEEKYYLYSVIKTTFPKKDLTTLTEDEEKAVDKDYQESIANEQFQKLQKQYKLKVNQANIEAYIEQLKG